MFGGWDYDDYEEDYSAGAAAAGRHSGYESDDYFEAESMTATTVGDNDFVQHVLGIKIGMLKTALPALSATGKIKGKQHHVSRYYEQYIPAILDEARANIAAGMDAKNRGKRKQFKLTLNEPARVARTRGNPCTLSFHGNLPEEDQHSTSMNALLISTNKTFKETI